MKKILLTFAVAALMLFFAACDKTNDGYGRLIVNITDAPFPIDMVESAEVTITKLEIRKAGDCVREDTCSFKVIWEGSETFNLLDLRNGVIAKLADIEIPEGEYDLFRLYVDKANLKVKDGDTYTVKVPGGNRSGIKVFINPLVLVEEGLTTEMLLDFDLSNSFVVQGNMHSPAGIKGFIFKPVIRAANNATAGRLEGTVKDAEGVALKDVAIDIRQGDEIVSSAISDDNGNFALLGLPCGTYSLTASKAGFKTLEMEEIIITKGNRKTLNLELTLEE